MPTYASKDGAIVVVAAEDDRFQGALKRATDLAAKRGEPLILYDWDAPSLLSEPMPTSWSSEGWDRQFPDRLDPDQLEELGRGPIADQVRQARDSGVDARLAAVRPRPSGLARYATGQSASIASCATSRSCTGSTPDQWHRATGRRARGARVRRRRHRLIPAEGDLR
jgi:hypothetical protein